MLGIIGGTGLYKLEGLVEARRVAESTPFGSPSSPITVGRLGATPVAFLAQDTGCVTNTCHTEINYHNLFAHSKPPGRRSCCRYRPSGACSESILRVTRLPNQFIDLTKGVRVTVVLRQQDPRISPPGQPTCSRLGARVLAAAGDEQISPRKTYACVEGPRLGTAAETRSTRPALGGNIVGMTSEPARGVSRAGGRAVLREPLHRHRLRLPRTRKTGRQRKSTRMAGSSRSIDKVQTILRRRRRRSGAGTMFVPHQPRAAVLTPDDRLTAEQRTMMKVLRFVNSRRFPRTSRDN